MSNKNGKLPYSDENVGNIDDLDLDIGEVPELSDKQKEQFKNRYGKRSLLDKFKRTWNGKNKVGKYLGLGLDIGESFLPGWTARIRDIFQSKQTSKPMLKKILDVKNFVNLKDEQGNFSWQELGYSVLQLAIAGGLIWGAKELGILNELMNLLNVQ